MSIDVNYYSFSPSRADKQWSHFVEDVTVLRKKHSTWHKHEKDTQDFQMKKAEIETSFEPRISEIRKKIFDFFDQKGYIIPWVEWNTDQGTDRYGNLTTITDEDKLEYLKIFGCVYPRGADLKNNEVPYLMLRMDAPELEESYDQIINERNEAIEQLSKQVTIALTNDDSVTLNKRQEELDRNANLSYLKFESSFNNEQLIIDLENLDIYYGSVANENFEDPKLEETCLETLIKVYNLKTENNIPTREEWIRLFQNISNEKIQEASECLASELNWNNNEAELAIRDYLSSVRPVVKDLKEQLDAIFVRVYWGEFEIEPKSAKIVLIERAEKNAANYKGQLLPVI